ncbi:MAG: stress response translation initiation inhibitor YciH [Candidatus Hodarchaeaceae archaeon]|nr:stress response translation initiation inhibitor YciH [Candidatus Hodarchaeaceae archaeon]
MPEVCKVCGLPKELCVCEEIAREQQRINVYSIERKFKKKVTIVEGIDEKQLDIKELTKNLKSKLACGGTAKDGKIELQGDHKARVKEALIEMGFSPDMIDIK